MTTEHKPTSVSKSRGAASSIEGPAGGPHGVKEPLGSAASHEAHKPHSVLDDARRELGWWEDLGAVEKMRADADGWVYLVERLVEQYAELEKAAAVLVAQPFGSLDQRAFYRLREVLGG